MNDGKYTVRGFVVLCVCSDGKYREAKVDPAGALTLRKTLLHVSHQKLKLYGPAVRIVSDESSRIVRAFRKLFRLDDDEKPVASRDAF